VTSLSLPHNHTLPDEARYYTKFVKALVTVPGTERSSEGPWISSASAAFYTKLVIYKDIDMFSTDPYRKDFPQTTATTLSTAVIDIVGYLTDKKNTKPIGFFLGQQASSVRGDDGHCWLVIVWKDGDDRRMVVRDSNGGEVAKVSEWTRIIAKELGVKTIQLVPATREERSSNKMCVELTYLALADLMDGTFLPNGTHEGTRNYDVISKDFEDQRGRKRKSSRPPARTSPAKLRKRTSEE
jgi:hypothetical protein